MSSPEKITYKAYYRDPKQNPLNRRGYVTPTRTVEIDASVPIEQVEKWAREVQEPYEFVCVEVVKDESR